MRWRKNTLRRRRPARRAWCMRALRCHARSSGRVRRQARAPPSPPSCPRSLPRRARAVRRAALQSAPPGRGKAQLSHARHIATVASSRARHYCRPPLDQHQSLARARAVCASPSASQSSLRPRSTLRASHRADNVVARVSAGLSGLSSGLPTAAARLPGVRDAASGRASSSSAAASCAAAATTRNACANAKASDSARPG